MIYMYTGLFKCALTFFGVVRAGLLERGLDDLLTFALLSCTE